MTPADSSHHWVEETSNTYRTLAKSAVPYRAHQIATMLTLMPFAVDEHFHVVELASGEGFLAEAILRAFPSATITALDIERSMREETSTRMKPFRTRGKVASFDIATSDWYHHLEGAHVVVSSLCIHHLSGTQKQHLFRTICERTAPRGALIIADLVAPPRPEANRYFAATWDQIVAQQSFQQTGTSAPYEQFQKEQWNMFVHPDPFDTPSPLMSQLMGLFAAGYAPVDCFWMVAGHAVFGGYKGISTSGTPLDFDAASRIAADVLVSGLNTTG